MKRFWGLIAFSILASVPWAAANDAIDYGPPYILQGHFLHPYGIALDAAHGRLLVADTADDDFQWMPVSQAAGAITWTTAGYISNRNDPSALTDPQALTVDGNGNVFVVNPLQGQVTLLRYGAAGYTVDGSFCNTNAHVVDGVAILLPRGIATGPDGAIYLLDSGNSRVLKASGAAAPAWTLWHADPSWRNPYGIAVDTAGLVYVSDTDNHRIVQMDTGGTVLATFGSWGTQAGQFRTPRGLAVGPHNQLYVADTFNHRIQIFSADRRSLTSIGQAPLAGALENVAVDSNGRIFAVDSDGQDVLAFLGGAAHVPYDVFMRDYVGDTGVEPSNSYDTIASPDILIRHQPDINLASATVAGLDSFIFQEPQYGVNNYVYLAVHNRGAQTAPTTLAAVYDIDPADGGFFPKDWKSSGFYQAYSDGNHNQPGNTLVVPAVSSGGVTVVGPLVWRTPKPESAGHGDGVFRLAVRLTAPYDYSPTGDSTTMSRDSNNVTERRVTVTRATTGTQNTLVVRADYPDVSSASSLATVQKRCAAMAVWISSVSYGQTQVVFTYKGPVTLPHNKSHYSAAGQSVVVDLVQDALNQLLSSDPTALDGSGANGEITRVMVVTNDLGSNVDWATTGAWPYKINGSTHYLTASVQAGDNTTERFSHGISHQLGLQDLYPYANVSLNKTYIEGWDNMAQPFDGAHPTVWSKELAHWLSDQDAKIIFVPRPAAGVAWTNGGARIHLTAQELAAPGKTVAVALGLTNGVGAFHDETAFYMIEMRRRVNGDTAVPMEGVLVYRVNSDVPQGQAPLILLDNKPSTKTLTDAALPVGTHFAPTGLGLSVDTYAGTSGGDVDLQISYQPPVTDYDVYLHRGDPWWESPDIWLDNKANGFDADNGRTPKDRGDQGIAGEKNRLYARVFNAGPATANDFELSYAISQPYHTVGGKSDFEEFHSLFIDSLAQGANVARYVTWTPETGIDPHTCVQVTARRLLNDIVPGDDSAQRNFEIDHSVHGSPYTTSLFHFQVTNATDVPRTVYFRADGIPADWTSSLSATRTVLQPGQLYQGTLQFTPTQSTSDCAQRDVAVTAWTPAGDTLVPLGGSTVQVDLQHKTKMALQASAGDCGASPVLAATRGPTCEKIVVQGVLTPPSAQSVTVRYADETGEPTYHTVSSDSAGAFHDGLTVTQGQTWSVQTQFLGTRCQGPAQASTTVNLHLPVPTVDDPNVPPAERAFCLSGRQAAVNVTLESGTTRRGAICPTRARTETLTLQMGATTPAGLLAAAPDILSVSALQSWDTANGGLALGHFDGRWDGAAIAGTLTADTTDFMPKVLWLDGILRSGERAGARLRGLVQISTPTAPSESGELTVAVESECALLPLRKAQRLAAAAEDPAFCVDGLPCLKAFNAHGQGTALLNETAHDHCPACQTAKAWHAINVTFKKGGRFSASQWETAESTQAGEQGSTFTWTRADGEIIQGEWVGVGRAGSEGVLRGFVMNGRRHGPAVRGFYRLTFGAASGRKRPVALAIHGFIVDGCTPAMFISSAAAVGIQTPAPAPSVPVIVTPPPLPPLEAPTYRPLNQIPAAAVKAFTQAEGGTLTADGVRKLQYADHAFRMALAKNETTLGAAQFATLEPLAADVSPAALLKRYDQNGDGQISSAEAPDFVKRYAIVDDNHDGNLSAAELAHVRDCVPAALFAAADTNHDGRVDFTEFALWYRTLPHLTRG